MFVIFHCKINNNNNNNNIHNAFVKKKYLSTFQPLGFNNPNNNPNLIKHNIVIPVLY